MRAIEKDATDYHELSGLWIAFGIRLQLHIDRSFNI